jgi:hypothetical protein
VEDGKLHKGLHRDVIDKDGSYMFGRKKKHSLSTTSSDYYGLPYRIYSATPGYVYKNNSNYIGNYINILEINIITGVLKKSSGS